RPAIEDMLARDATHETSDEQATTLIEEWLAKVLVRKNLSLKHEAGSPEWNVKFTLELFDHWVRAHATGTSDANRAFTRGTECLRDHVLFYASDRVDCWRWAMQERKRREKET